MAHNFSQQVATGPFACYAFPIPDNHILFDSLWLLLRKSGLPCKHLGFFYVIAFYTRQNGMKYLDAEALEKSLWWTYVPPPPYLPPPYPPPPYPPPPPRRPLKPPPLPPPPPPPPPRVCAFATLIVRPSNSLTREHMWINKEKDGDCEAETCNKWYSVCPEHRTIKK